MIEVMNPKLMTGAVSIGRNEGARLVRCLTSLKQNIDHVIYVDSGSTDNSVKMAKGMGVDVIELDLTQPFTAARARNAGLWALLEKYPHLKYVQFIDGDCEIIHEWVVSAFYFLEKNNDFAVACGRRKERFPEQSVYNHLCDIEWNTPIGEALACGGDTLIRVEALKAVAGYNETLIAGEEPEMCFRMRQLGWKIMRLDADMTWHDAAMTRLSQWWKRNQRAGHAYAEGYALHGSSEERYRKKEVKSILFWAGLLPFLLIIMAIWNPLLLFGWLVYPLQWFRLYRKYRIKIQPNRMAAFYAFSNIFGKLPQIFGIATFLKNRLYSKHSKIIEYK